MSARSSARQAKKTLVESSDESEEEELKNSRKVKSTKEEVEINQKAHRIDSYSIEEEEEEYDEDDEGDNMINANDNESDEDYNVRNKGKNGKNL